MEAQSLGTIRCLVESADVQAQETADILTQRHATLTRSRCSQSAIVKTVMMETDVTSARTTSMDIQSYQEESVSPATVPTTGIPPLKTTVMHIQESV